MERKITLQTIIDSFLENKGITKDNSYSYDADSKSLRRGYEKLIEKLGSNMKILKQEGTIIEFGKEDIPYMKILLTQIYDKKGVVSKLINGEYKSFSSIEVQDFLQDLADEADKEGFDENDIKRMVYFFTKVFCFSNLRIIEDCHRLIDTIAFHLQDLTMDQQVQYLYKVKHILKKEVALRIAESAINMWGIASIVGENMDAYKELQGSDFDNQMYFECDPEIRFEYMQRDGMVLEAIKRDDDLRYYIEKKIGIKAEEIFNYASLT